MRKQWIIVGVLLLAVSGAGCETSTTNSNGIDQGLGSQDASGDVSVGSCHASYGIITCKLTIVNHSEGKSDYYVEATIEDSSGAKIGTANTLVTGVEGGQTAYDKLTGTVNGNGKEANVRVTEVQRTSSS